MSDENIFEKLNKELQEAYNVIESFHRNNGDPINIENVNREIERIKKEVVNILDNITEKMSKSV